MNNDLLDKLIALSKRAGDAIMDVYESDDFGVESKQDDSGLVTPLTRADKAAHNIIVDELAKMSDYDIVSEEGDSHEADTDMFWLVDPLDGTKEFVKRNGEFTVNIALVKNGRPVLGVVYAPVLDVYYCGDVEAGEAFKIKEGERKYIKSEAKTDRPVVASSRSHKDGRIQELLDSIGEHDEIVMGSSLKLCLVAEGAAMISPRFGPTSLWDTAAADAVVTAAGGAFRTSSGDVLNYNPSVNILNPHFVVEAANNTINWKKYL